MGVMDERQSSGIFYHVAPTFNQSEKQPLGKKEVQRKLRNGLPRISMNEEPTVSVNPSKLTRRNLPLLDVTADIGVIETNSRSTLTQVFSNCSDEAIKNATYVFPLYDGSTIVSFNC